MVATDQSGPRYTDQARLGDKGVRMVDAAFSDGLGWIVREQSRADLGIDAHVEVLRSETAKRGSGRLLALQIKCGTSWFAEPTKRGWTFRGDQRHLDYWLGHSLPVLLCLCNPTTGEVFWAEVTRSSVDRTPNGWKIVVPRDQRVDASAATALLRIAQAPHHADLVELLVPLYLTDRFRRRIYIHPLVETPRDFGGVAYMTVLDGDEILLVDYIYTPMERMSRAAVEKRVRARSRNELGSFMRDVQLLVLAVGDSAEAMPLNAELATYVQSIRDLELTRLLYTFDLYGPELEEIDECGCRVWYDEWGDRHEADHPG